MSGPYYLVGDTWLRASDRGRATVILHGSPDPHVGRFVANTDCISGCQACDNYDLAHHRDAVGFVHMLNTNAPRLVEEIGFYEDVEEQDCQQGTTLGYAFEQGWNAALTEVRGRAKPPRSDLGRGA